VSWNCLKQIVHWNSHLHLCLLNISSSCFSISLSIILTSKLTVLISQVATQSVHYSSENRKEAMYNFVLSCLSSKLRSTITWEDWAFLWVSVIFIFRLGCSTSFFSSSCDPRCEASPIALIAKNLDTGQKPCVTNPWWFVDAVRVTLIAWHWLMCDCNNDSNEHPIDWLYISEKITFNQICQSRTKNWMKVEHVPWARTTKEEPHE